MSTGIFSEQPSQGGPDASRAFQPASERRRQGGGVCGFGTGRSVAVRRWRNVERDAQVAVLGADFLQRDDAGEAGIVGKFFVGLDDVLNVFVGQETLGAFAGDFVDGVDEQDFAPAFSLFDVCIPSMSRARITKGPLVTKCGLRAGRGGNPGAYCRENVFVRRILEAKLPDRAAGQGGSRGKPGRNDLDAATGDTQSRLRFTRTTKPRLRTCLRRVCAHCRCLFTDCAGARLRTDCGCDPDAPWTWLWSRTGHDPGTDTEWPWLRKQGRLFARIDCGVTAPVSRTQNP